MHVLERIIYYYRTAGYELHDAGGTVLWRNGSPVPITGGGVAWSEVAFFEHLASVRTFKKIAIIGNAFGFSTILCALLWPNATVSALDCADGEGMELTARIAAWRALNVNLRVGRSPEDCHRIMDERTDMVFIDGEHTNRALVQDFAESFKLTHRDCCYVCHDILGWGMRRGFKAIKLRYGLSGTVLDRTFTGIGILYPGSMLDRVADVFSGGDEATVAKMRRRVLIGKTINRVQRMISTLKGDFLIPAA